MAGLKVPLRELLTQAASIEGVVFSHVFNNQFELMEEGKGNLIPFPCLLIEIVPPQEFTPLLNGVSQADLIIRVHIGHQEYDAGNGDFEQDLNVYDLRDKVIRSFTNFKPTACTPLFKVAETQDYNHGNVFHYIIDFKTGYIDTTGSPYDVDNFQFIEKTTPTELVINVTVIGRIKRIFNKMFKKKFK